MIRIKDGIYDFQYKDIKYENSIISPEMEIRRCIKFSMLIKTIKNTFAQMGVTLKPLKCTIDYNIGDILGRTLFDYYSATIDAYKDGFFPYISEEEGPEYNDKLLAQFSYKFALNCAIKKVIEHINIPAKFREIIVYLNNPKYTHGSSLYTVNIINKNYVFKSKLKTRQFDFTIHTPMYNKLKDRYTEYKLAHPHNYELHDLIYALLIRYNTLNSSGHQWGIPIQIKDELRDTYGVNFECFASAINHHYKYYCSMFYDIEKYFMSLGNFQYVIYKKGFYIANPPYDQTLLENMVNMFITLLDKTKPSDKLTFMFGLPNWSSDPKFTLHIKARESKYFLYQRVFKDKEMPWFDFESQKYKRIASSIRSVISNDPTIKESTIAEIVNHWASLNVKTDKY